ncbi:MAG: NAD-dependent epimerase/dehydratase family protein [Elusimicrobia bacterium]|nr:NAD-dependent epimerase/dehydratase family protein [Elusimicrobiota bacterium]
MSDLKNKKVLITGGLGFIGSNIALRCLEEGAEVTVYDCLDPRSGGNMYNLHGIEESVRIVVNDIRSMEGISSCIRGQDILFNCAAYTSHPNSMREPLIDIDVNCKGTINILESARRFNPEIKFIHVGTSTQTGKMCCSPVDEKHPEFPLDIYSANKTASEKYVLIYGSAYKMRTTVVRLANVFGPRSNIKTPDFGFMNYFIGLALQGKPLTVYGEGSQLRNITYVRDCVEALVAAALNPAAEREVFFAVGDTQYSVAEIAAGIAENVGGQVQFVEWPRERFTIDIGDAVISNEKIKRSLGWSPRVSMTEGLVKTREYFTPVLKKYL